MKLDIIANDGSPLGVTMKSVWGEDGRFGVGGAELALLTMCEGWHNRGYEVTLYNNPSEGGVGPFEQRTLGQFDPLDDRDYLIVFRSPNDRVNEAKGRRIWWSCDQFTIGDFKNFSRRVDKVVTISKFHADYFQNMYGIGDTVTIDLPVRDDYEKKKFERIPKRCIYTSVPDRGAMQLHAAWPLIHKEVPDASLVLTSDWRLWDANIDQSCLDPYRLPYARHPNCSYVGAVKREELIEYQLQADLLLYPSVYPELFCITVAEAQVSGAIPVTSRSGAIETTNEFGYQIDGVATDPKFIEDFVQKTVQLLQDPDLKDRREDMMEKARNRFSLRKILGIWDKYVFS